MRIAIKNDVLISIVEFRRCIWNRKIVSYIRFVMHVGERDGERVEWSLPTTDIMMKGASELIIERNFKFDFVNLS